LRGTLTRLPFWLNFKVLLSASTGVSGTGGAVRESRPPAEDAGWRDVFSGVFLGLAELLAAGHLIRVGGGG
jgi:hypothetical protein